MHCLWIKSVSHHWRCAVWACKDENIEGCEELDWWGQILWKCFPYLWFGSLSNSWKNRLKRQGVHKKKRLSYDSFFYRVTLRDLWNLIIFLFDPLKSPTQLKSYLLPMIFLFGIPQFLFTVVLSLKFPLTEKFMEKILSSP